MAHGTIQFTHLLRSLIKQTFQHNAAIMRRAPHEKIFRRITPTSGKPFKIGLKTVGGDDKLARRKDLSTVERRAGTDAIFNNQFPDRRFIAEADTQPFGMAAQCVEQGPATAKENAFVRPRLSVPLSAG